jgi:hypothetical protein
MTRIKQYQDDKRKIMNILKDMDMKLNHLIERLKQTYNYLNTIASIMNSKH